MDESTRIRATDHTRRLLRDLGHAGVWPDPGPVEVRQTHLSVVFLTPHRAFKLKKALDLGFVDHTTVAARDRACEAEVRLNRRLAPDVYLGLVPVGERDGRLVPGVEPAVEHAVAMVRLPDAASLLARVESGTATAADLAAVARRIAAFHAEAEAGPHVAALASLDVVAANARENFAQTAPGPLVHDAVWTRVRDLTEAALDRHAALIRERAPAARDTHGDLRLEHIYLLPAIVVIDCVEFTERFRYADPASDLAFLVMDLGVRGRDDLAAAAVHAWVDATGDVAARRLLPFYVAYRSVVRAKVAGMQAIDPAVPDARRRLAEGRARRHWLYALSVLAGGDGPCLIAIGGLPGTGKSTVAAHLPGVTVIRADVVRKELAGMRPTDSGAAGYEEGLYTPRNKDRVYDVCLERARDVVLAGGRAVIDASWSKDRWRQPLIALGAELGVPVRFVWCEAPPDVVRARLAHRTADASDADWSVYLAARDSFEPATGAVAAASVPVDTTGDVDEVVARVDDALRRMAVPAWAG